MQDHANPNLLFLGTEFGLSFTIDGGVTWMRLRGGMPAIAIRDLEIQKRESDLVAASFGRGFFVLDDYAALRQITPEVLASEAFLFARAGRPAPSTSSATTAPRATTPPRPIRLRERC